MSWLLFVVILFLGATTAASLLAKTRKHPTAEAEKSSPYCRKKFLFSAAERSFYEVIRRLLPHHTIFAKVRLADVLYIAQGTASRQGYFNRIAAKHVDFLVCDENLSPQLAIELDDSSHQEEQRRERDAFVDQTLKAAGLPIVRVRAQRSYALDSLRAVFESSLSGSKKSAATSSPTLEDGSKFASPEMRAV